MDSEADARAWDFAVAPPRIAPGVSSMVGYRALGAPTTRHRGLPSSRLTFILALDDGVRAAPDAASLPGAPPVPVLLGGLHTSASHVQQHPFQAGVQLAVHPLAARTLFGLPASELSVTDFDGTRQLGRSGRELHERVLEAEGWSSRFDLIADELIRAARARDHRPGGVRPELLRAWQLLERSGGRSRITDVAAAVGLTPRHLRNLFVAELGRTPKQIAGLMRFERATTLVSMQVERTGQVRLAEVAAAAGYSDQAHLSREFTRYIGTGPRSWISEEFRNLQDGGHGAAAQWAHER